MNRLAPLMMLSVLGLAWPIVSDASDTPGKAVNAATSAADTADVTDKIKREKVAKTEKTESTDQADEAAKVSDPAAGESSSAQADAASTPKTAVAGVQAKDARDDAVFNPAQPDFTLISLHTTLRLPQYKSAFRVTHRFTRPLEQGSFGSLADDLFGLDSAAQIGLEFRFGLLPGLQGGLQRTNDRDIQFFAQYDVVSQSSRLPFNVAVVATIDGANNFKDSKSPGIGAIVSRTFGKYGALYVEPVWVNNTNPQPADLVDDNNTVFIGVGGRVQVRKNTYVVAEVIPRVGGFEPGVNNVGVGVEKRVGGHMFQINFQKGFGTTMVQIARGGPESDSWFIGFNVTRKFF
jgi:hypothetical protein